MPERVFDLSTTVATTPEAVVDFLVDLNRHHGLHPFLVRAAPGCSISTTTRADAVAGGSLVGERALVRAPRPLLGYMAGQAEQAHARTFRLLPGVLA